MPLLIGGATTSRVHTAVKIHPNYRRGQTVYVNDASRAVGVAQTLMSATREPATSPRCAANTPGSPPRMRARRKTSSGCRSRPRAPMRSSSTGPAPTCRRSRAFIGTRCSTIIRSPSWSPYIDWTPFFQTWELVRQISGDPRRRQGRRGGAHAVRRRAGDAATRSSTRNGSPPAPWSASGRPMPKATTFIVYGDEARDEADRRAAHAAPAAVAARGPRQCLRSPISSRRATSRLADYIGAFAVTAGIGEDEIAERFKRANDDYSAILVKALADRLAEAFAERLHQRVRKEFWGYAPDETLSNDELIAEKYRGIRPAPGYPAQPDHTEKATLFSLLDGERIGVKLTESYAMWPGASVCGLYFSHPESALFRRRQDRARPGRGLCRRKGWSCRRRRALAGADPQLRSAPVQHRRGVIVVGGVERHVVTKKNTGEISSPVSESWPVLHRQLLVWRSRRPLELRMHPAKSRQQKQTRRIQPVH